jgi:signal transduction histidine kinase
MPLADAAAINPTQPIHLSAPSPSPRPTDAELGETFAAASLVGGDVTALPLVNQELTAALRLAQFGPYQVVLPLVRDGLVLGLLAVGRQKPWTAIARTQVETVARTLAATALMDRRHRWLERLYHHHQTQRHQQQEQLHDLLHQFRNPLTAIRTFGKLVLRRLQPGAREQTMAEGIVRESERLQALLEQFGYVVDWDRDHLLPAPPLRSRDLLPAAESTPVPLLLSGATQTATAQVCPLADTLEQAIASTQAIAREKSITVTVHLPATLPPVQATPALLQEVASNLMDNAVKYTPAGGQVQIAAAEGMPHPAGGAPRDDCPWVVLVVSDTGYGIPAADLERVFERRYRGIQAETEIPGTGLGLAIAQQSIQAMGGTIRAFSPAIALADLLQPDPQPPQLPAPSPAQGSTFALWLLPAAPPPTA